MCQDWFCDINLFKRGSPHEHSVYGWNRLGKECVFSPWRRCGRSSHDPSDGIAGRSFALLIAQLPPLSDWHGRRVRGAHEWARRFATFGHSVKLMAPKFVAPYRKGRQERRQ